MDNSDYPFDHVGIFKLFVKRYNSDAYEKGFSHMYKQMTQNKYVYIYNVINTFYINL